MRKIEILDSTLRDGAQGEGINFSVEDKLTIVKCLDELGITYIEAGNPGSNPKDIEFFERARLLKLKNSKLAAFGPTRRCNTDISEDAGCKSILSADTQVVVIFGKSWDFHVTDILRTDTDENLRMISDTVGFFKSRGKEVIYDAEHFFDGYKANPEYALRSVLAAEAAGADRIVLCETNGGCFPNEIGDITAKVKRIIRVPLGIHCHNDMGCAVANSLMAVNSGAEHIQGTYIGFGERCGNANLAVIIPSLQMKLGYQCIPDESLPILRLTALKVAETANLMLARDMPYVGQSAFSHKAGMHSDAVAKTSSSFEHIDPAAVGNERYLPMSEVAGRSAILERVRKIAPHLEKDSPELVEIAQKLKELEHAGCQFEGADASFEIMVRKQLGKYRSFFELDYFKTIIEQPVAKECAAAMIKIAVDGKTEITAADGDGPVHALDLALRKSLEGFYPRLKEVYLTDFKVRVVDPKNATDAMVRVLIETSDGERSWTTMGVSTDIIQASWRALVDSIEYKLIKDSEGGDI